MTSFFFLSLLNDIKLNTKIPIDIVNLIYKYLIHHVNIEIPVEDLIKISKKTDECLIYNKNDQCFNIIYSIKNSTFHLYFGCGYFVDDESYIYQYTCFPQLNKSVLKKQIPATIFNYYYSKVDLNYNIHDILKMDEKFLKLHSEHFTCFK